MINRKWNYILIYKKWSRGFMINFDDRLPVNVLLILFHISYQIIFMQNFQLKFYFKSFKNMHLNSYEKSPSLNCAAWGKKYLLKYFKVNIYLPYMFRLFKPNWSVLFSGHRRGVLFSGHWRGHINFVEIV